MRSAFIIVNLLLVSYSLTAQKVGVVLSGGGASGSAHVGVLKALEQNEIPIDYIVGTSVGAIIGGFYAAGYSPNEIERIINSPDFRNTANGIIDQEDVYFIKSSEVNAGFISVNFNLDSILGKNLPTNFVSSIPIDYGLMEFFSPANAVANGNFDSLFIPFRALAANISKQKQTILRSGNLATAIRASMTYPFYIQPVSIDGDIMFDGGLYNNFPVDIMCQEFNPDYIIASNVASLSEEPSEDNLISQLRSILTKETNFEINCTQGIIIDVDVSDVSTFDFYKIEKTLNSGYQTTIALIDSIKQQINKSRKIDEVQYRRTNFKSKTPALIFDSIKFDGNFSSQSRYFKKSLKLNQNGISSQALKPAYYRLASNEKIKSAYPIASYDSTTGKFDLNIGIKQEKSFKATFGGVVSSKPFSTGFFQLEYQFLRSTELKTTANIYFGSFYNSIEGRVRWDIPFTLPFYVESQITANRYDFFNSRAPFINEVVPPFIINSENYIETKIAFPIFTNGKLIGGHSYLWQDYEYYQNEDFVRGDTADLTEFEGNKVFISYQRNSLNRKQYATTGNQLMLSFAGFNGREKTTPGSTSPNKFSLSKRRNWIEASLKFDKYFLKRKSFHIGTLVEMHYSDIPGFHNSTITQLTTPGFEPLPENRTLFLPAYRSRSYTAIGLKGIYSFRDLVDIRLEGYLFQPNEDLRFEDFPQFGLVGDDRRTNVISTLTTVYHSRLGPLAGSINYYERNSEKFSFLIHFGYIIFNKKAFD